MLFFNRLLTTLGIVVFMLLITAFLVLPGVVIDLATNLNSANFLPRALQFVVALGLDALLALIVYRLWRTKPVDGLVVRSRNSRTAVNVDDVQRQLETRMAEIPGVSAVRVEVKPERGNADVTLYVTTGYDTVLPNKQKEISRAARKVLEKQLGLRLAGPPTIHIDMCGDEEAPEVDLAEIPSEIPPEPEPVTDAGIGESVGEGIRADLDPGMAWMTLIDEDDEEPVAETEPKADPDMDWMAILSEEAPQSDSDATMPSRVTATLETIEGVVEEIEDSPPLTDNLADASADAEPTYFDRESLEDDDEEKTFPLAPPLDSASEDQ